ncbi:hypothetical protein B9Z55_027925 [Caenorhabditis nigoni]|uniref:Uncharacterized protein n=1 Tax=Caenorhabditis nigoni TaxID=1611254 RepID=A0A2G5SEE0_9PELO|nr:hypothetical protein B9Z55_027925 [Caenorhabditis nigoni]
MVAKNFFRYGRQKIFDKISENSLMYARDCHTALQWPWGFFFEEILECPQLLFFRMSYFQDSQPNTKIMQTSKINEKKVHNNYHPNYNLNNLATLPDLISVNDEKSGERESSLSSKPNIEVMEHLKKELAHLPLETILSLFSMHQNNLDATLLAGKKLFIPEYVPEHVQNIVQANIAFEREEMTASNKKRRPFYLEKQLRGCVDSKDLVKYYYDTKNQENNGDWRREQKTEEGISDELRKKLAESGIEIISQKQEEPMPKKRGRGRPSTRGRPAL